MGTKPDHLKTADQIQQKIYQNMTPAEKWNCFLQIRQTAYLLKTSFFKQKYPELNDQQIDELVKKVFSNIEIDTEFLNPILKERNLDPVI